MRYLGEFIQRFFLGSLMSRADSSAPLFWMAYYFKAGAALYAPEYDGIRYLVAFVIDTDEIQDRFPRRGRLEPSFGFTDTRGNESVREKQGTIQPVGFRYDNGRQATLVPGNTEHAPGHRNAYAMDARNQARCIENTMSGTQGGVGRSRKLGRGPTEVLSGNRPTSHPRPSVYPGLRRDGTSQNTKEDLVRWGGILTNRQLVGKPETPR